LDLIYEGAILYDDWTLNGVGLMSGETIKARERPDKTIVLSVYSAFNNKVYHIYDQFRPIQKHIDLEFYRRYRESDVQSSVPRVRDC